MGNVTCYYFVSQAGRAPARDFIESLDIKTQSKFFYVRELLEEFEHRLPYPHAKYIEDGIFELRFAGREGAIRLLYFFFHKDKVIFTNGFIKKANKTPKHELNVAIQRKNLFIELHKEDK